MSARILHGRAVGPAPPGDGRAAAPLRSLLFVPADDERKLANAMNVAADALILDLEDSVSRARKARARELAAEALAGPRTRGRTLWVRINALDDPEAQLDLEGVMPARPDGLVLPKPRAADDIVRLDAWLDDIEPRFDAPIGSTLILPIATETPSGVFALGSYAGSSRRLAALTWGAEDLGAALGAATAVDERGEWLPPYQLVRSLTLLAAADAGVAAIDTVYTSFRDDAGLVRQARAARRDGFAGKLAVHPAQVPALNEIFKPQPDDIEQAKRIVDAFAAAPDAGVVALDGRMLDRPHLVRARRVLASAAAIAAAQREALS
jgi:citrate lyase subunit beta / citryl-CoA lyase